MKSGPVKTQRRGILRRGSSKCKRPEIAMNLIHWRTKSAAPTIKTKPKQKTVWPKKVNKGQKVQDKVTRIGHKETVPFNRKENLKARLK